MYLYDLEIERSYLSSLKEVSSGILIEDLNLVCYDLDFKVIKVYSLSHFDFEASKIRRVKRTRISYQNLRAIRAKRSTEALLNNKPDLGVKFFEKAIEKRFQDLLRLKNKLKHLMEVYSRSNLQVNLDYFLKMESPLVQEILAENIEVLDQENLFSYRYFYYNDFILEFVGEVSVYDNQRKEYGYLFKNLNNLEHQVFFKKEISSFSKVIS